MAKTFYAVTVTSEDGKDTIAVAVVFAETNADAERMAIEEVAQDETETARETGDDFEFSPASFAASAEVVTHRIGARLIESRD